jgi:hypothetical protein
MEVINLGYQEVMLDSFYFIDVCSGILVKIVILYYFVIFLYYWIYGIIYMYIIGYYMYNV